MVYKKYIRKNGKEYGPYVYHSRRVDGKVVSEYHGQKVNGSGFRRLFVLSIIGVLILVLGYFLFSLEGNSITGNVALGLEANYLEGEILDGTLKIFLSEGELLPEDTLLILEGPDYVAGYNLSELLTEETVEGEFYVGGSDVSGEGTGHGVIGVKEIYPEVSFVLKVLDDGGEVPSGLDEDASLDDESLGGGEESGTSEETEEDTQDESSEEGGVQDETVQEEVVEDDETAGEIVDDSNQESDGVESEDLGPEGGLSSGENGGDSPLDISGESVPESLGGVSESVDSEAVSSSEESEDESSGDAESTAAPITGNVVGNVGGKILGFFRSLTPTGEATKNIDSLEGVVSKNKPYTYTLGEGQIVEIVSSSEEVNVEVVDGVVTVTTDYFEIGEGYGEDYLGDVAKVLEIDLNNLAFSSSPGNFNVRLEYSGEELISLDTVLADGDVLGNISSVSNVTTNETLVEEEEVVSLTSSEINVLVGEFGNSTVEITRAEIVGDRIVVKLEIEEYWIEYSYDSDLDEGELSFFIEEDRIRWLKDLAATISEGDNSPQEIGGVVGSYKIV